MELSSGSLIHRFFYLIIHTIFTFYEFLIDLYEYSKSKFTPHNHEIHLNGLGKVPRHLTILLGSEEPSLHDLANLVLWSIVARIPYISFYDQEGKIKHEENQLRHLVEKVTSTVGHVVWHHGATPEPYRNGFIGRKVHVKVLSNAEGRLGLVNTVKTLAVEGVKNVNIDELDCRLREHFEFPDPDLGLWCGRRFSIAGFPPWQSRITEFLPIKTVRNLTFRDFAKLLQQYDKCEQRFGK